ncbi:PRA1 family protein E [Phytophthora cinnamomi]|uniref:PRA1 family protein E n=1 Tax=Phytophthora cinnamomi TaxID=4785 RepID=UPI003559DB2C|nr:PRA1 family protein E [Phytophthora cinnamomi]
MLNSSASHAHMSPPPSPRVRKVDVECSSSHSSTSSDRDLGQFLLDALQRRVAVKSMRSLFSCAGVGETEPFNLPPQHRMLARMKTNASFFLTNYLLLTVGVFAFLLMFFHPIQLLVCIVVGFGWHVFLTKKEIPTDKFEVFGRRLSEQDILLAATGSTMVFLLFFVLPTVIFALSVSSLASAAHALLRNNRLKDDSLEARQGPTASSKVEELV